MCTSIVEIVNAAGAGKGGDGWFNLTHSVGVYDHPHHAVLEEAITSISSIPRSGRRRASPSSSRSNQRKS